MEGSRNIYFQWCPIAPLIENSNTLHEGMEQTNHNKRHEQHIKVQKRGANRGLQMKEREQRVCFLCFKCKCHIQRKKGKKKQSISININTKWD